MGPGCVIGESALVSGAPMLGSVRCAHDAELLVLTLRDYQAMLQTSFEGMVARNVRVLTSTSLFASLMRSQLEALAAVVSTRTLTRGTRLCRVRSGKTLLGWSSYWG